MILFAINISDIDDDYCEYLKQKLQIKLLNFFLLKQKSQIQMHVILKLRVLTIEIAYICI